MLNDKINKGKAVLGEKPASMAQVRTRVGLGSKKSLKLNKAPLTLAQTSSESDLDEKEQANIKMFL